MKHFFWVYSIFVFSLKSGNTLPVRNCLLKCFFLGGEVVIPIVTQNPMSSEPKAPMWSAAAAESLQSCLTLCNPIDGSPPGYPVPGILQARTLKWVAISFSNA